MQKLRPWAALRSVRGAVERLPPVQHLRVAEYERQFAGDLLGAFHGVYGSFDEAHRSAPTGRPTGFDVGGVAEQEILRSRVDRIFPYDYPVLFWLRPLLVPGAVVFDYGGHVGVHFYAYGRVLEFPPGLTWTVCELPAVVEAGRTLAVEREAPSLRFTGSTAEASGADVLIASGVLQYVESPPLGELLAGLAEPPGTCSSTSCPSRTASPSSRCSMAASTSPRFASAIATRSSTPSEPQASSWWTPGRTTSTG
jgi:hypothetical protein